MKINLKQIRLYRRTSQVFILILFIIVPILNSYGITYMRGNFFGFNFFGIPLIDPFSALQTILGVISTLYGSGISFFDSIAPNMWVAMTIILAIAFFFGPIFCSWICPYGFFSELVWKYLGQKKKWQTRRGDDKPRRFYLIKFFIFFVACILTVVLQTGPVGNTLSMPGWYSKFWQDYFLLSKVLIWPVVFFVGMLVLEFIFKKRFWCLYLCPQSVMLAIVARISPYRMHTKFHNSNCTCPENDKACLQMCSLGLNSRKLVGTEKMQCTNCFECARACARGCKSYHKGIQPIFTFKE